jgi:hypothetical protein
MFIVLLHPQLYSNQSQEWDGEKMNKNSKLALFSICLIAAFTTGILLNPLAITVNNQSKTVIPIITGTATIKVINAQGQTIYQEQSAADPLTSTGSSLIISAISNITNDGATHKCVYLGLSTDASPLVTWTTQPGLLSTNNLGITTALTPTYGICTTASGLSTYMILTNTWSPSGTQTGIQCLGAYYVSTGASGLVCASTFSSINVISGDSIIATYNITMPVG